MIEKREVSTLALHRCTRNLQEDSALLRVDGPGTRRYFERGHDNNREPEAERREPEAIRKCCRTARAVIDNTT